MILEVYDGPHVMTVEKLDMSHHELDLDWDAYSFKGHNVETHEQVYSRIEYITNLDRFLSRFSEHWTIFKARLRAKEPQNNLLQAPSFESSSEQWRGYSWEGTAVRSGMNELRRAPIRGTINDVEWSNTPMTADQVRDLVLRRLNRRGR